MSTADQIKQTMGNLLAAIAARTAAEERLEREFSDTFDSHDAQLRGSIHAIEIRLAEECRQIEEDATQARVAELQEFAGNEQAVRSEYQSILQEIDARYAAEHREIKNEQSDARWMVTSLLDDDSEANPKCQLKNFKTRMTVTRRGLRDQQRTLGELTSSTAAAMMERRQWREFGPASPSRRPRDCRDALDLFEEANERIREDCRSLRSQKLARLFVGWRPGILFLLVWAPLFVLLHFVDPTRFHINLSPYTAAWTVRVAAVSAAATLLGFLVLFAWTRAASGKLLADLSEAEADLKSARKTWLEFASAELQQQERACELEYAAIVEQRHTSLERIDGRAARRLADWSSRRQVEWDEAEDKYPALLQELARAHEERLASIDENCQRRVFELVSRAQHETSFEQQQSDYSRSERSSLKESIRHETAEIWQASLSKFVGETRTLDDRMRQVAREWSEINQPDWTLPDEICHSLPLGRFPFDLSRLPGGLPSDRQLWPEQIQFSLPLILPFPANASVLLKARGEGRALAAKGLKTLMLRLLTSLPAGKLRFTVIDPVGLGEEFSAFMHLADFDEQMIGTRIWTQTAHIEKRLAELSEHIETVFQAYLRNEFETIEDYNRHAGEVAEPYHFVVVSNFPANFSEAAARRLVSIATSGPRCGVHLLMSVDTALALPHHCDLNDLETMSTSLTWREGKFHLADRDLGWLPFQFDSTPAAESLTEIVRSVGKQSQHSRRVEVPFERIAPRNGDLWKLDSRSGLDVPLGRAGATKLQHLRLGRGTSQHVLVAGKTGSGKSSFLHALITNMALNYSPNEVEFLLIDFKKGVEFKTYATNGLPHARVIGIESDREFGVSVLERLDGVLKERGDLFRRHGVQDIEQFRNACPADVLPRILLVVDEFQEFFVEDDALSQSAGLLLDRLVRQGRAFGIHVLLGSQTLGGAYSLARSTLGQVAVRVALQCSESDAHLILSEDNTAARLLSRPGEAIYNDANGLLDGNHPFQVAWLSDNQRDMYLKQIQQLASQQGIETAPPVVFEGNVPSDPSRNRDLVGTLESIRADAHQENGTDAALRVAWLGEAVSIKPPTKIEFRRRPGNNLMIVGQDPQAAHGLLAVMFVTLAAQRAHAETTDEDLARFEVLDGAEVDSKSPQGWERLAELVPHRTVHSLTGDVSHAVAKIADLVTQRMEAGSRDEPPVFLIVSNLSRLRDLKADDDDYGFSTSDSASAPSTGRQFATILRDGPSVGMHTIVWCDSYSNLNRWFSARTQREFEMRVAFQMNAADSSNFIDSPSASRLGTHRALLYLHETGQTEKFRPYAIPGGDWLKWVASCFRSTDQDPVIPEPVIETCDNLDVWTIV